MPEDPGSNVDLIEETTFQAADGTEISENSPFWRKRIPAFEDMSLQAVNAVFDVIGLPENRPEISIVLADNQTVQELNRDYRNMDKPTNVLSFPLGGDDNMPAIPGTMMLGDVILAFETVSAEAISQDKSIENHTSHLIVHGVLHLLGHDHEDDAQADAMETLEKKILATLGIDDPYVMPDEGNAA